MGLSQSCAGSGDLRGQATEKPSKAFETLRAEAAIRGIVVHRIADEHGGIAYLVGRWNWSRSCTTVEEAEAFIERLGAAG